MNKTFLRTWLAAIVLFSLFLPVAELFAQVGDPLPFWGGGNPVITAVAPVNGTTEVQTITFGGTPTGGTFRFTFQGFTTGAIAWSATNATLLANIDTALKALPTIGTTGVVTAIGTMTAGIGTITVTFAINLAKLDVPQLTWTSALIGTAPTLAVTTTTPGVTADGRSTPRGQALIDMATGTWYSNKGTFPNPNWTAFN